MQRKVYLDYLKVLACLAVIVQHCCSLSAESRAEYTVNYFFYFICRFAVPIFVMATGSLMLDDSRSLSFKAVFIKYIPRILIPFVGIVYVINITAALINGNVTYKLLISPLLTILKTETSVPYWYCYMIIGIYLMLPFIKKMVSNCTKRETEVFLVLFFLFRGALQYVQYIPVLRIANPFLNSIVPGILTGYIGYLVLGYYINKYIPHVSRKMCIVCAAVILVCLTVPFTVFAFSGENYQKVGSLCADVFSPGVMLLSAALMILMKGLFENTNGQRKIHKVFVKISKASFGIYLLHVYAIQVFSYLGVPRLGPSYVHIPLKSVIIFAASFAVSAALQLVSQKVRGLLSRRPKLSE